MSDYIVKFYEGDYMDRQKAANRDNAIVYIEHHFNAASNPKADYALCVVGDNAGRISREFGQAYAASVASKFGCKVGGSNGILIGGYNGRGNGNVKYTEMPAILLEPLFVSNPNRASQIKTPNGRLFLAEILVKQIRHFFPNGGLVAFSVGHKYRTSKPNDRGASVIGGGSEADYAEMVLREAERLLSL